MTEAENMGKMSNTQNHQSAGGDSSPSGSHDFVEKFEHMEPGYGDERTVTAEKDVKSDDNPYVHEHVSIHFFPSFKMRD